jgi:hypothetical protein
VSVYKYDPEDEHFLGEDDDFTALNQDFEVTVNSVFLALNDCEDIGRFVWNIHFNVAKKTVRFTVSEDRHGQVAMMMSRLHCPDGLTISVKGDPDEFTEGHTKVFSDLVLKRHDRITPMRRDYESERVMISHRLTFTYGLFEVRLPKTKPIKLRKGGR